MPDHDRSPRAIRLDALTQPGEAKTQARKSAKKPPEPRAIRDLPLLEPVPDEAANGLVAELAPPPPPPRRKGFSWATLLLAALGGIVSLAIGLAVDQLIRDLFERNTWLGYVAAALAALAVLAALALTLRELLGIFRLRAITRLREDASEANRRDDPRRAKAVLKELVALYSGKPETAHGRRALTSHMAEIIDGSDLIALAERDLLAPLDAVARTMVMDSAKRVSIVTAVSPRAIVDLAFVLSENMRLIRRLSQHYGGRPGTLGFWRLARDVLAHLAATGAIALGDGVVQQLIGHGLAARLSARLGEGVVNGLLTARIGVAAMDVCRPVAFIHQRRPGISDFLSELVRINGLQKAGEGDNLAADAQDRDPATGRNMR